MSLASIESFAFAAGMRKASLWLIRTACERDQKCEALPPAPRPGAIRIQPASTETLDRVAAQRPTISRS